MTRRPGSVRVSSGGRCLMVAREVMERDEREGTVSGSIPSIREREGRTL